MLWLARCQPAQSLSAAPAFAERRRRPRGLAPRNPERNGERSAAARVQCTLSVPQESAPVKQGKWQWKGASVHWEQAGDSGTPILLLPGFGVGTFHFQSQFKELSRTHRVYGIDLLGQGKSWPEDPTGLQFSAQLWASQVEDFIREVIKEPAYLVGNSLGGYLSVCVASQTPELARGLILLNATPFWSQAPNPETEPAKARRMPWDGTLPAPWYLRLIVGLWWNTLRNPTTVRSLLKLVYSDTSVLDRDAQLIDNIIEPTTRPIARDVFVSIFLSPKTPLSFNEMLQRIKCPVALVYGKEDPWVVPLWGQRLKRIVPDATYYEISPAGHCPHHERPEITNVLIDGAPHSGRRNRSFIVISWIGAIEQGTALPLSDGGEFSIDADRGYAGPPLRVTAKTVDGSPRNPFEKADYAKYQLELKRQEELLGRN